MDSAWSLLNIKLSVLSCYQYPSSLLFVLVFGRDGGGWQGSLYGNLARLHPPQLLRLDCNHSLQTKFWVELFDWKEGKAAVRLNLVHGCLSSMSKPKSYLQLKTPPFLRRQPACVRHLSVLMTWEVWDILWLDDYHYFALRLLTLQYNYNIFLCP